MLLTILHVSIWFQKEAPSSRENRTPPIYKKKENILMNEWTEPITEEYPVLWTSYFLVYLSWLLKYSNKMTASCNPAV